MRTPAQIRAEIETVTTHAKNAQLKRNKWSDRAAEYGIRLTSLEEELQDALMLLRYPPEPKESVVRFDKRYASHPRIYSFAAIRANGSWWVTGSQSPQGLRWRALVDFMRKDNTLSQAPLFTPLDSTDVPF